MSSLRWVEIDFSEGAPVFVGDLPNYTKWRGTDELESAWTIHCNGPVVERLPGILQPAGRKVWHQHLNLTSVEQVRLHFSELVEAAKSVLPEGEREVALHPSGRQIADFDGSGFCSLEFRVDGQYCFRIGVGSSSDYGLVCQKLHGTIDRVGFDGGAEALFFPMEGDGILHIGMDESNSEIVILQRWVDHENAVPEILDFVTTRDPVELGEITFRGDVLFIVDSVVNHREMAVAGSSGSEMTRAVERALSTARDVALSSSGIGGHALRIREGRYSYGSLSRSRDGENAYILICAKLRRLQ